MSIKKKLFLSTISLLLSSCGNYTEKKSGAGSDGLNLTKATLDFSTVQREIFAAGSAGHCVDCHQQYNSYAGVKRELDSISSSISANRMPKVGGALSDQHKALLQAWIAIGSPEFPGQTPIVEPVIIRPNWQSISENILLPRCLACHNPNGQAKFLDLSTRQAIFSSRNRLFGEGEGKTLLDFEQPAQSYLLDVINDDIEPMPPVWSNIRRLNEDEISVLTEWIGLGLP